MAQEALKSEWKGMHPPVKDVLAHVRTSTQELHKAISDAVAKRGGATKADLEAIAHKIKTAEEDAKNAVAAQNEAGKTGTAKTAAATIAAAAVLTELVHRLNSTQKNVAEAHKASGHAFQTAIKHIMVDARAAAEKASEAVAELRAAKK